MKWRRGVGNYSQTQMITKGAVEEMLSICGFAEYGGKIEPLTDGIRKCVLQKVDELNESGMRVIAVAQKHNPSPVGAFSAAEKISVFALYADAADTLDFAQSDL